MEDKAKTKTIEIGKFYFIHDDSSVGHPGFVVWKNDEINRYIVVRTDSDKEGEVPKYQRGVRHITKLKHLIGCGIVASYVKNRPLVCKRKDIGVLLPDLSFHPDDMNLVNDIAKRKPELSRSLRPRKKK